ncbi:hypothetical protein QR680_003342 [Steinernema hermaphroditum]|uniref:Uncharacterized protein n=1 Tax=Steinernema hermaphroditum TaxID=289476 RepID=A0AA39H8Y1_9BILA|nr:hypothetical protein QR680_003342 [Steinernema hermaphroditum]
MAAKLRQHSLSSVRKLQELVNDCNAQLASFRSVVQCIGTSADNSQLRKDLDASARACIRSCEACTACVLPQVRHEGVEFTRNASQYIGCVSAIVIEMKRCEALEATFPASDGIEPAISAENYISQRANPRLRKRSFLTVGPQPHATYNACAQN